MKKYLYTILSLVVGMLSSCSNSDTTDVTSNSTILTLSVDGAMSSRSDDGVTYYVEAYSDDTYSEPAKIFDNNTSNKASNTTGSLSMILDRSKEYYFLFFATKDASCYNIDDLKSVSLANDKNPSEAWFGSQKIEGKSESVTVELKRCVAKLSLIETGKIPANSTLTLTFDQPTKFDVSTGSISSEAADNTTRTEKINFTDAVNGSSSTVTINSDIFILAPSGENSYVTTLNFQMTNSNSIAPEEDPFNVTNVPFKANSNTNIKGHYTSLSEYTFNVSCNQDWNSSDNDTNIGTVAKVYKIGDLYPDNVTPVGVVFDITDNGSHGKIVSFDEISFCVWNSESTLDSATDSNNGLINMKTINDIDNGFTTHQAFLWVHRLNEGNVSYSENAKNIWYLPSINELIQISKNLDVINSTIASASKNEISKYNFYWSSTECNQYNVYTLSFPNVEASINSKGDSYYSYPARAVLAF